MSYRYEIRLSGEGGQGIVLAGVILAEAAAIYDGKNATQTQVYGPESRGGRARPRSSSAKRRSTIRRPSPWISSSP